MKKLISLVIVAIMLLAAIIPAGAATTQSPIIGYSESLIEKISDDKIASLTDIKNFNVDDVKTEYKISDAEGLEKFATIVAESQTVADEATGKMKGHNFKGVTVYLVADIDLSASTTFHPIGNNGNNDLKTSFQGTFDGQGHTVVIDINGAYSNGCGFFAGVANAVVKNFILEGKVVNSKATTGGIAGWIWNSDISNVLNRANVSTSGKKFVGGIAGDIMNNPKDDIVTANSDTKITNVTNEGNITGLGQVGGFIGRIYVANEAKNNISKCVNYGVIRGTNTAEGAAVMSSKDIGTAGIIGHIYGGTANISECYNFGDINASKQVGGSGIIGVIRTANACSAIVTNCFNKGVIKTLEVDAAGTNYGELVGAYAKDNTATKDNVTVSPVLTVVKDSAYEYDASLEPKADEPVVPPASGDTDNKDDEQNKNDDKDDENTAATDKKDENAASTDKPGTTNTSNNTEPAEEKGGCGGAIMGAGMVLMAVCACGCAVVSKKRR